MRSSGTVPTLLLPTSRYGGEEGGEEEEGYGSSDPQMQEEGYDALLDELPETAIGDGVDIRGELQFDRLLRVDGTFEGNLRSSGSIVVGRKGCLIADVNGMETLIIDGGKLIGNVQVDRLILRGSAFLEGNFSCKSLVVGAHCTILGRSNVHSLSPEIIDVEGDVVVIEPTIDMYHSAKTATANDPKAVWAARLPIQLGERESQDTTADEESVPFPQVLPPVVYSSGLGSPRDASEKESEQKEELSP